MNTVSERAKVFIIDETYLFSMEDERSAALSSNFMRGLEAEFGAEFYKENIGPGFDIPAFGTVMDVGVAFFLFFKGAEIIQGWEAWAAAYLKLHRFLHRKPVFDRNAAAVVALDRVIHSIGNPPKSLRLEGYSVETQFTAEGDTASIPMVIGEALPDLHLGVSAHVFNITADGRRFRVRVAGSEVQLGEN
ncbi:hypothetical protein M8R20_06730 [Pseudomonas sp. R2.Fl]|nr:hypothetical protein [Pseudomonas sp. R2.Fl]